MKKFFGTVFAVFLALILFFVIVPPLVIGSLFAGGGAPRPDTIVLELDLRDGITDQPLQAPFAALGGDGTNVIDAVLKLRSAEKDDHVKGVLIRFGSESLAPAHVEELVDSLKSFKAAGKFVYGYMQSEVSDGGLAALATLAGADKIFMQAAGDFGATGARAEITFLKGTFDKFSVDVEMEQFAEYKSAADTYTKSSMTAANKEATGALLTSIYDRMLVMIAEGRKSTPAAIKAIIEAGPYTGDEMLAKKLVDVNGTPEDAEYAALFAASGKDAAEFGKIIRADLEAEFVDIASYEPPHEDAKGGATTIAIVGGEGEIITGDDGGGPFADANIMTSDTVSASLLEAAENPDVAAIVFRVSSPGGSALASDQIYQAVARAKALGKPVVISMGAYAASGGYYVSTNADKIVAWPTTITGSIGVFGGKIVIERALNKYLGANTESLTVGGPYTNAMSETEPFTPFQKEAFKRLIARIYEDFTGKVAAGRKLPIEQVKEVAKGRVWTGADALPRKLVDQFGGLKVAIAEGKKLAKLDPDAPAHILMLPQPDPTILELRKLLGAEASHSLGSAARLGALADDAEVRAILDAARKAKQARGVRMESQDVTVQ